MPSVEYRKVMNRALPLIAVEYWERGEHEAMLTVCDGVFFCEPLFVYTPGIGTAVYYNWSDARQDPDRLVEFFNAHPETYAPLEKRYLEQCDRLSALARQADPNDFAAVSQLLVDAWPMFVICNILGKWDPEKLRPEVQASCYRLREETDTVFYQVDEALIAMAQRKLGRENVGFLLTREIASGEVPSTDEIAKRERGYVFYKGNLYAGMSLGEFTKTHTIAIVEEVIAPSNEVTGQSASNGIVRGTVKVVFEHAQMTKVQQGDILVAPMTTPDFMPAIHLASALVTDEGGITCHAAIVARELGKPCIIGTKAGTRLLRDGDEVEVDAGNGTVRILRKAT